MSTFIQIVLNTIIAGGGYILLSLGFNLIFKATKFFDVSSGALITIAGYVVFYMSQTVGCTIFLSVLISLFCTVCVALLLNKFLYRPLRKKNANSLIFLITSLGVYTCIVAIISILFSSQYKTLNVGSSTVFGFLGGNLTAINLVVIFVAIFLSIAVVFVLYRTKYGQSLRAIDDDKTVAEISGIDVENIITKTIILAACIIGTAGIVFGFDTGLVPAMGLLFLLKGIIASIVGGVGSIEGGVIGAIILAVVENIAVFFVGAQWRDPIAFFVFIIILIIKPHGLFKRI